MTRIGTTTEQVTGLLDRLQAGDVRETEDRVYFTVEGRERDVHKDFPIIVVMETAGYCNLVCVGCPQKDMTRRGGFMDEELFRKVVDEVAQYDVRTWFHYMGEPLMHPKIFDLVDYSTKANLPYFGMSSNAVLLTDSAIERVLDSGLQRFEISMDSLDPDLLNELRPGAAPQLIIDNAHEFFRRKYERGQVHPITSVSIRRLAENAHEIDDFVAHWNEILQPPDFVLSIAWNTFGGYGGLEHAEYGMPLSRRPCLKLWNSILVLWDGTVVSCDPMFDAQVVMGNVNYQSLHDIWNGEKYRTLRQRHLDGDVAGLSICAGCTDWYRELVIHDNLTADEPQHLDEIRTMVTGSATS